MKALVVGAGVVGQVYARHLEAGGASVSLLVKPEHRAEADGELRLFRLHRAPWRRSEEARLRVDGVLTDMDAVQSERWDQVYLTISSPALRADGWFAALAGAIGDATLVVLQPGPGDRDFVLRHVPEGRVVQGVITLIGYPAPLPGETRFAEGGVAYWLPPGVRSPMSGPAERVEPAVATLRRGGLPARRVDRVADAPFGAAFGAMLLQGLESAGWSFDRFLRPGPLGAAVAEGRRGMRGVARHTGQAVPLALRLAARPILVRAGLRIGAWLAPFDLESYLRVHFTKVGEQMAEMRETFRAWEEEVAGDG